MKNLTAILVDDIPAALQLLASNIQQKHTSISIIGQAKSIVEAAKLLQKEEPDILFLDIMLGDGTGFDLLEIFPNLRSNIIFVTASDEYAIKAFKFAAIDYILKPYSDKDLQLAIQKASLKIKPDKEQFRILKDAISLPNQRPQKISLHTLDKIIVVDLNDIIRCKSDNNYTEFFFSDKTKILVTKTLKTFSNLLKRHQFLRVHQSHLVNSKYIKEFIKSDGGYLVLKDKSTVPVSIRKRTEVMEALHTI
ncbi:MAG: DNA-binding response regulator [Gammaproteobacteria bacterium]|nr:DNA-binding response regulator [Gammaproteobacteria bacterium]MDG1509458.1 LytTR family DNA-binding domain-containing protein [Flavobacteriaceae bacterium]MDG2274946.1 LytTR family DNA-binding domain-containing protein [Flavobacteriaceae bacterium]|tara:strand:- start:407 stop:1156 length:750 start_codon:yes stop_codon:yes gene_type:complete